MKEMIITENLTKHFGSVQAVSDLSLRVNKGEIYGFLGLNGAGKTTTIRMLLGMIRPDSGYSAIDGEKVQAGNHAMWKKVGYLVEVPYSYPELTVRENLEIIRRMRFIQDKNAVETIIGKLKLGQYAERKSGNLSLGNAQRLGLAKALLHDPQILLLDEPANALDPAGIVEIRELLLYMAKQHGVTIFISSHILGEVSKFADRIGIIHEGRLIRELAADELEKLLGKRLLIGTLDNKSAKETLTKRNYPVKETATGTIEITDEKAILHPEEIATILVQAGLPPTLLRVAEEDLESYFLRTIGVKGGAL